MKTLTKVLWGAACAAILAGCSSSPRPARTNMCAYEKKDGNFVFKELGITMAECPYGTWDHRTKECSGPAPDWRNAMHYIAQSGRDKVSWHVPSRVEMEKLGQCLVPRFDYAVAEIAPDGKLLVYKDKRLVWSEAYSVKTIYITGGDPAAQAAFEHLVKEQVSPGVLKKIAAEKESERAWYAQRMYNPEEDPRVTAERLSIHSRNARKGTSLNCTSKEVVPVNWTLDSTNFVCPTIGTVTTEQLRKHNWKIAASERTPAQAMDFRSDDYGMDGWNGRGVSISISLEKR